MVKQNLHFIGTLANVDSSILNLNKLLKNEFEVRSANLNECIEFYKILTGSSSLDTEHRLILCYMIKPIIHFIYYSEPVEVTELDNADELLQYQYKFKDTYRDYLKNLFILLRLYKEGDIRIPFQDFYFIDKNDIKRYLGRYINTLDREFNYYTIEKDEINDLKNFLDETKLPFRKNYLKFAFENFNASYEVSNDKLKFLSLMNAIEVLFHPSDKGELRYRISRNLAVLLGIDEDDSQEYFNIMRNFYDKRSDIVHRGNAEITDEDISTLREYVRESIKIFLKLDQNKDEILKSLNSLGFGDSPIKNL